MSYTDPTRSGDPSNIGYNTARKHIEAPKALAEASLKIVELQAHITALEREYKQCFDALQESTGLWQKAEQANMAELAEEFRKGFEAGEACEAALKQHLADAAEHTKDWPQWKKDTIQARTDEE